MKQIEVEKKGERKTIVKRIKKGKKASLTFFNGKSSDEASRQDIMNPTELSIMEN